MRATLPKSPGSISLIAILLLGFAWFSRADSRVAVWGSYWYVNGGPNQFRSVGSPPLNLTNAVAIAGGAGHSLALRADGTVAAWGENSYGQARVPVGLTNVVAVAAGFWHNLALRNDGSVAAWGAGLVNGDPNDPNGNQLGQSIVPANLTNAVAVAAGWHHSLALRADGTVIAWGANNSGQTNVPPGLGNVVAIASGGSHCLALKADGTIVAWGRYFASSATNVPPGLTNAVAISAANGYHSLALKADGSIVGWGEDNYSVPSGLSNAVAIAAGGVHSLALEANGAMIGWGTGSQSVVPANLTSVAAIAAGWFHSLAVAGDVPPFISAPLLDRTVLHGSTAWLWIGVNGSRPLSYQWRFNGIDLPNATNALLELVDVQFDHAGLYSVVVSNALGTATSRDMRLHVAPLFISAQPESEVTLPGRAVQFNVTVTGREPFRYQWQFEGENLVGATNSTLVLTNVLQEHAGNYAVIVSNALGTVRSIDATVSLTQVAAWGNNSFGQTNVPSGLTNVVAVAGGLYHSVALKADGSVSVWGSNEHGQTNLPAQPGGVAAVAAGLVHSLALRADGTVVGWGENQNGRTDAPPGLTNAVAIAAGSSHSLALKADGAVVAWGFNYSYSAFRYFPVTVPTDWTNVVAIAAGQDHSLALKADGKVVAWSITNSSLSVPSNVTNVVAISARRFHNIALRADGTVVTWGINQTGKIDPPPASTNALWTNVVAIAAGDQHSLALQSDGTIIAWGAGGTNASGFPRGPPSYPNYGQSIIPPGLSNVTAIAAGGTHSLAVLGYGPPVLTDPLVNRSVVYGSTAHLRVAAVGAMPFSYQWRFNGNDLRGATNSVLELENVQFGQAGAYSVVVSNAFGAATSSEMSLGVAPFFITAQPQSQNTYRGATVRLNVTATGQGPFSYQWRFNGVDLPGASSSILVLPNAQVDQSGEYGVLVSNSVGAMTSDSATVSIGTVIAWGDNTFGQTRLPTGLTNVVAIAAGDYESIVLRGDGTVVVWGDSGQGQTNMPPGLTNVVAIAAGWTHSLALKADGTVVDIGNNAEGQFNIPSGLTNVVAIAAGSGHTLALRSDGTLVAWGNNEFGQARVPFGLTNVVAVAAGIGHSIALRADGTLRVWGDNSWGSIQPPQGLSNVVAVASGWQHSLALKGDGTVTVWGVGYAGQTNTPFGLSNVVAISAGGHRNLALKADGTLVTWGDHIASLSVPPVATNIVAIAAGAAHSLALVDSQLPLMTTFGLPAPETDSIYFRQTGLMEQVVRVFNRSSLNFPAVRLVIHGLAPGSVLYNASGTNSHGQPYVQYNRPLAPGASVDLTLEYFVPNRSIPNVSLVGEVVSPEVRPEPIGTIQPITRSLRMVNGSYLIDFSTLTDRTYYIQYSSDLATWKTAHPPRIGSGSGMQWVDNGPPKTESHPSIQTNRFYRVLLAP